jgi:hypothetical protein
VAHQLNRDFPLAWQLLEIVVAMTGLATQGFCVHVTPVLGASSRIKGLCGSASYPVSFPNLEFGLTRCSAQPFLKRADTS